MTAGDIAKYAPILCWAFPIIGALLTPALAKIGHRVRDIGAVVFSFLAVVFAASMIPYLLSGEYPGYRGDVVFLEWVTFPGAEPLRIGFLVDPLSIIVANAVALISFLIMVYSLGYMHGDPCLTRYWFFMLFFIGNMLLLVLSDNFIQLLIGWEGVGMCSYALIGYYYRDERKYWVGGPEPTPAYPPSHCGMKAFVVTGVGDVFLLAAIFIIYAYTGTFNFVELTERAPEWMGRMAQAFPGLLSVTSLLLLGGPAGKSAQFPLHEWLPEAMAGPTSVSALIHAATMVKAGVYLVARLSPMFFIGGWAHGVTEALTFFAAAAVMGGFTAFLAASQAMVSIELKKVLAYSTVSQIGYMMLALGAAGLSSGALVEGLTAGVFHLISHALFKAALFLCAGSVLHAVESIYMTDMGGLKKYMPITHAFMLIAALSLSGIPPLSGFWSKDAVFKACLVAGTPLALVMFAFGAVTAAMTFFYSLRFIAMTFYGEESEHVKHLKHEGVHIHEAPAVMWVPYGILVALVILVGVSGYWFEHFLHHTFGHWIAHIVPAHGGEVHAVAYAANGTLPVTTIALATSAVMLVVGGLPGYLLYVARRADPAEIVGRSSVLRALHKFLWNRWYINPFYYKAFVDGTLKLKQALFKWFEMAVVDKVNGAVAVAFTASSSALFRSLESVGIDGGFNRAVPYIASKIYRGVRRMQTGILTYNMFYVFFSFLALLIVIVMVLGG